MEKRDSKTVTLVTHTKQRAHLLRQILEMHNVPVELRAVSENPVIYSMEVYERDLPLAIKILESTEPYSPAQVEMKLADTNGNLLIPVDFSDYSMLAVTVGFELAKRLSLHPLLLHTYSVPIASESLANLKENISRVGAELRDVEERNFGKFVKEVRKKREEGEISNVRFSIMMREGLPEEVIADYCRLTPPALIVMATRGRSKKEAQIIGSVTAEVIDSCRVPIFTVPECYKFPGVEKIEKLGFFSMLDRTDLYSIDALMRMFTYPKVEITLFPFNDKASRVAEKIEAERTYCSESYPLSTFQTHIFSTKNYRQEFETHIASNPLELLVIPNKRSNIFSRLFKPGIAHRMLFERDIPMLVIPV